MTLETASFPVEPQSWHALRRAATLGALKSDAVRGLSSAEAKSRLERAGPNALPEPPHRTALGIVFAQVRTPLVYLLAVAAALALALGHVQDAAVILVVVVLNAVLGAIQEGRAERALWALRRSDRLSARLFRDGREVLVPASEVVPGDLLLLQAGDAVAADSRLLDCAALQVAEAALTGESVPSPKSPVAVNSETPLADRRNMVYAGTHVTAGRARALVVATGPSTEVGRIAHLAETAQEPKTPLELRIAGFGRALALAAAAAFALVVAIGLIRSVALGEILMIGISQLVGMVPEGLPVAMTVALAIGVQRMARRGAVVRRLVAVETLGSTTVICADKTGTLTQNELTVTQVHLPEGPTLSVTGTGFSPDGAFLHGGQPFDPAHSPELGTLLVACALCNDASFRRPAQPGGPERPLGDPTEVALLALALKGGVDPEEVRQQFPRLAEVPFDPAAGLMATEHRVAGRSFVVLKGAPEEVLSLCQGQSLGNTPDSEAALTMASKALRVLALARVDGATVADLETLRGRAVLLGLVGQIDPSRPEAEDAVRRCRAAGIRPVMVTGDHKVTGLAIAHSLGIAREGDLALEGREFSRMSADERDRALDRVTVFARVHPAEKLEIVEAFQRRGEVVAMTGDGVNDAPALARADVGVAMGRSGTEVAKQAAKVVLSDDNFATLVKAVEEGRLVYQNLQKAVLLLLSTSVAEVLVLVGAMALGYPPPFAAVQILWNNLITEGLITVNLAMEPPEGDEMQRAPVPRNERLLNRLLATRMAFMVPAIVLSTLGWFVLRTEGGAHPRVVQTETFTLLAVCEWFNVLNCRFATRSVLRRPLGKNPYLLAGLAVGILLQACVVFLPPLQPLFHTAPLEPLQVGLVVLVGSAVLWVEELRKLFARRGSSE